MVAPGTLISVSIDKPAVGGPMLGRVDGQVVLVTGAIPGERVIARIERVGKGVAHAQTVSVEESSADRREPFADPACGGCLYSHIAYQRQLEIKAQVVADALARIGGITLPKAVDVQPSPESGYRMRARLHVRHGRLGFFREGTHDLCDARATGQLLPASCDVLDRLAAGLRSLGMATIPCELDLSENVGGDQRVVHVDAASELDTAAFTALARTDGLTGFTIGRDVVRDQPPRPARPATTVAGDPHLTDLMTLDGRSFALHRHVRSFFQGNRYLLRDLVTHVIGAIEADREVVDLYAGVGLFAVAAAVVRSARVIAVEGDRCAARDLAVNARASGLSVEPVWQSVETFVAGTRATPQAVIVDPPRTGLSREALDGAAKLGAARFVYVSCDVATLARDARRLLDRDYKIRAVDAFDLFPNTPHVETVMVLTRS